jgi:O-acetyl-ADP-ribose deacetylase (regulator of RNase III)
MQLSVMRGDLTEQHVDAVVNAANQAMRGGGGVDGAIHRRGGPEVLADCVRRFPDGLATGRAGWTTAGRLPARWVIHCVGPVWSPDDDRTPLLRSCYIEALRVADDLGARTVGFPAISAGAYRWPLADAATVAVDAVRSATTDVQEVRFVLFSDTVLAAFTSAVAASGRP